MKKVFSIIILTFSLSLYATSKQEVSNMLDKMQGMFTKEELEAAKSKLKGMNDDEFKGLVDKAQKAKDDPEIRKKLQELQ